MASLRQPSFAGGEIAPELSGRSDAAKHAVALRTCRNFLPTPYGAAVNRPGMAYLGEVKYPTTDAYAVRLIPFVFAANQNFLLEFGQGYLRFWYEGALVAATGPAWSSTTTYAVDKYVTYNSVVYRCILANNLNHVPDSSPTWWAVATVYELATPWTGDQAKRLKYAQCGDVLTLCHPEFAPRELKRLSNAEWTLTQVSFSVPSAYFPNDTPALEMSTAVVPDWSVSETYVGGYYVFYKNKIWRCLAVSPLSVKGGSGPDVDTGAWEEVVDDVPQAWQWKVTTICIDPTGRLWETAPFLVANIRLFGSPIWWADTTYASGAKVSIDEVSGVYYTSLQNSNNGNLPTAGAPWWDGPLDDEPGSWDSGTTYAAGQYVYYNMVVYRSLQATNLNHVPDSSPTWWKEATVYDWRPQNGTRTIPSRIILRADKPAKLSWPNTWMTADPGFRVLYWRIYRGLNGQYGLVGEVPYPESGFTDIGGGPDYSRAPPRGTNPFSVTNQYDLVTTLENPAVVAYYQQRRIFADTYDFSQTKGRPATLFGSRTNDFANFDKNALVPSVDDAIELTLSSLRYEEIRALVPLRRLLVLTSQSEWSVGGAGEAPLSGLSADPRLQSSHGSDWLDPIVVGRAVLFLQESGHRVRALNYDLNADGYTSSELSIFATHLLDGRRLVDWGYVREPFGLIWAVRDDGVLLTLTFEPEQEVLAWAWHDTQGKVEAVCVVPEEVDIPASFLPAGARNAGHVRDGESPTVSAVEDAVYLVVQREPKPDSALTPSRYIERLTARRVHDIRDGCFLDCAKTVDGRNKAVATTVKVTEIAGGGYGVGAVVKVESTEGIFNGWAGSRIVLNVSTASPIRLTVDTVVSPGEITCTVLDAVPAALQAVWTNDFGKTTASLTLTHLAGLAVMTLEDGVAYSKTVNGVTGLLQFNGPSVVVHVGLPYTSDLELLDLAAAGTELRSKLKTVHRVDFEVYASRGLSAGETFDKLTAWKLPAASENGFSGTFDLVPVRISNTWNRGGRACLRQTQPLPLTVLSAIREVELGGT